MNMPSQLVCGAVVSGLAMLAVFLPMLLAPGWAYTLLKAFPRSAWPGRVLAALDVVWFAFYVLDASLPWIDANRWIVFAGAPVLFAVIVLFMDELLSVRAFGALLLLAAQPLLDAAFPYQSQWRLVLTTFAYCLVLVGSVLVWSPYLLRKVFIEPLSRAVALRCAGAAGVLLSLVLLGLGLFVYPGL